MNSSRLLEAADYLDTVPRQRFCMTTWADGDFCGKQDEPNHKKHECQTSACAMGWLTTDPRFKRIGLKLGLDNFRSKTPVLGRLKGIDAACKLFGINTSQAWWLFDANDPDTEASRENETPKQVARRIRKFVKDNGKIPAGAIRFEGRCDA